MILTHESFPSISGPGLSDPHFYGKQTLGDSGRVHLEQRIRNFAELSATFVNTASSSGAIRRSVSSSPRLHHVRDLPPHMGSVAILSSHILPPVTSQQPMPTQLPAEQRQHPLPSVAPPQYAYPPPPPWSYPGYATPGGFPMGHPPPVPYYTYLPAYHPPPTPMIAPQSNTRLTLPTTTHMTGQSDFTAWHEGIMIGYDAGIAS